MSKKIGDGALRYQQQLAELRGDPMPRKYAEILDECGEIKKFEWIGGSWVPVPEEVPVPLPANLSLDGPMNMRPRTAK